MCPCGIEVPATAIPPEGRAQNLAVRCVRDAKGWWWSLQCWKHPARGGDWAPLVVEEWLDYPWPTSASFFPLTSLWAPWRSWCGVISRFLGILCWVWFPVGLLTSEGVVYIGQGSTLACGHLIWSRWSHLSCACRFLRCQFPLVRSSVSGDSVGGGWRFSVSPKFKVTARC